MSNLKNTHWIIGLMILQLAICIPVINHFPIALDEPFSIFYAQQDLADLADLFVNENNPPLHFILLHFWIKIGGISAFSVRLLSLLFSVLTIPFLFKIAQKLTGVWGAVSVVLLFIFSNFHHYHALEARTYALFVFLFAVIFYYLYGLIFEHSKKAIIYLAIANAALLYTHYLGGFIVGVEGLVLLYFYKHLSKKEWKYIFFGGVGMLLLFIPGIRLLWIRLGHFSDKGTWVPPAEFSELYGNIVRFFNGKMAMLGIILMVIIVAIIYLKKQKLTKLKEWGQPTYQFVILMFALPYFGMFIISKIVEPIFLDRYLLFTTLPLYVALVFTVQLLLMRKRTYISMLLVVPLWFSFNFFPDNNREPDEISNWINNNTPENRTVLICPPFYDLTFLYHHNQAIFKNYRNKVESMKRADLFTLYNQQELKEISLKRDVVFIDMDADFLFPENGINTYLNAHYTLKDTAQFKGKATVYYYK